MKTLPADFLSPGFQNNFLKEGQCIQLTAFSHSPSKEQNVSFQKGGSISNTLWNIPSPWKKYVINREKNPACVSERKKYFLGYLENHVLISSI